MWVTTVDGPENDLPGHPIARTRKPVIRKAFLPGAGLGTRLRPLTDLLPKPLVPLFHKPLVEWAMEACLTAGITDFAINTHHLPGKWPYAESEAPGLSAGNGISPKTGIWKNASIHLFHEPVLLETGGGVKNIEAWAAGESVLVHNGDIYSSLPLHRLIAAHQASPCPVTLAVRSTGDATPIAMEGDRVKDIRGMLGLAEGTHVFTGIYCFDPELFGLIPPGRKISVIPAFLELAKQGRLGAVILDEGEWRDLGDQASYLAAHRELALAPAIHPAARIDPAAIVERCVVGPGAEIGPGAVLRDSVIWPGARVQAGSRVLGSVVPA